MGLLDRLFGGGRKPATPAAPTALDKDALTLGQLAAVGANLSLPRETNHYLYVSTEADATAAATRLASDGRTIETRPAASGGGWVVLLTVEMVVNKESIGALRAEIESAANEVGGTYDGWEAGVPELGT